MKCPKCKNKIIGYPAISRKDNKTKICSTCGVREAFECLMPPEEIEKMIMMVTKVSEDAKKSITLM